MKTLTIALWVSCLALMALIASCGSQNIGSPIPGDQDAAQVQAEVPGGDEVANEDGAKDASYTPGGYAYCYGPYQLVNHHYNYTFYWGTVKELPDGLGDKLAIRSPSTSTSGVRYWFMKGAGQKSYTRIRRLEFQGFGTNMQVHLLNVATNTYDAWQTLNMNAGAAMGTWPSISVGPQHINAAGRVVAEVRSPMGQYNELYAIYSNVY